MILEAQKYGLKYMKDLVCTTTKVKGCFIDVQILIPDVIEEEEMEVISGLSIGEKQSASGLTEHVFNLKV